MKKVMLVLLLVILAIGGYVWYKFSNSGGGDKGPKQQPLALKKHSETFNNAVSTSMNAYFDMSAALVDADTARVKAGAAKFTQLLDSIPMDELKKDTASIYDIAVATLNDIKTNAQAIVTDTDIQTMRMDFKNVSENLYPFFKIINYEGENMYWQNCPMAFDAQEANWISKSKDVVNPYLGKNHPKYKGTMLHCGSVKDTIKAR